MNKECIIAIDQGTTGNSVFIYDKSGKVIAFEYKEFTQIFPKLAWVEHDPEEIWQSLVLLIRKALSKSKRKAIDVMALGITNQRETAVIWDRKTSKPIYNAIVWQCRRTTDICQKYKDEGYADLIHKKTGLVIDAYFSGTKWQWILDNVEGARVKAENGDLFAGTIDSWLLFKLTGEHSTDYTNASRTMLYNIQTKDWDQDLLKLMNIPSSILPNVYPSRGLFGKIIKLPELEGVPVCAMVGDQQAALFGQQCTKAGDAKNTYGTGSFFLLNTGEHFVLSQKGILTTLACNEYGHVSYALEGSVFIAGAVMQWLRDEMKFYKNADESEKLIKSLTNEIDEVVFVPAFVGLGAPYWDMKARGAILGITRNTSSAQITRAALKSIAFQTYDLIHTILEEAKSFKQKQNIDIKIEELKVDGGACSNNYLMQFQADILQIPVVRPSNIETTAIGAAFLAGLEINFWTVEDLKRLQTRQNVFTPKMNDESRIKELEYWKKGVERSLNWG